MKGLLEIHASNAEHVAATWVANIERVGEANPREASDVERAVEEQRERGAA